MKCVFCKEPIDQLKYSWSQVSGFERPANLRSGTGSSLVLRRKTGKAACNSCITGEIHGVTPGQMSIEDVL